LRHKFGHLMIQITILFAGADCVLCLLVSVDRHSVEILRARGRAWAGGT
jgi:hypothetical protein